MVPASCWPTLALFVACCPNPSTIEPDVLSCPSAWDGVDKVACCTGGPLRLIFDALGDLTAEDVASIMPDDNYESVLNGLSAQLELYVRDVDLFDPVAWRLLAIASLRSARIEVDKIKDRLVGSRNSDDVLAIRKQAVLISRRLNKALLRIENFQQFLLNYVAAKEGSFLHGIDPEIVRPYFGSLSDLYKAGMMDLDTLVYTLIPHTERAAPDQMTRPTNGRRLQSGSPTINLLTVSLGTWVKVGFITLWSLLRYSSCPIRVFILCDFLGCEAWRDAVKELYQELDDDQRSMLSRASFEYIEYMKHPRFQAYMQRYPTGCTFTQEAYKAILARVICHEVLPADVTRIISIDLGDIIVLDDIHELWSIGNSFEQHHVLAAAHAVNLHHVNGGFVLYDVGKMRSTNFTEITLQVVKDSIASGDNEGECLRDQSIINVLHDYRQQYHYPGPSPVMLLPCRWSIFPANEWQLHWNFHGGWLPEIIEKRRYPGIISKSRVEVYCPDPIDYISNWASTPLKGSTAQGTRHARIRMSAIHDGMKTQRYCSAGRPSGQKCCKCGAPAALVHVAGDLKSWPSMRQFLYAHSPPWKEGPVDDGLLKGISKKWWGGQKRMQRMFAEMETKAYITARIMGLTAMFKHCETIQTMTTWTNSVVYHRLATLNVNAPFELYVDTTMKSKGSLLLGTSSNGLEIEFGAEDGNLITVAGLRSGTGWTSRKIVMKIPFTLRYTFGLDGHGDEEWVSLIVAIDQFHALKVESKIVGGRGFAAHLPPQLDWIFQLSDIFVSVASDTGAKWGVCSGLPP